MATKKKHKPKPKKKASRPAKKRAAKRPAKKTSHKPKRALNPKKKATPKKASHTGKKPKAKKKPHKAAKKPVKHQKRAKNASSLIDRVLPFGAMADMGKAAASDLAQLSGPVIQPRKVAGGRGKGTSRKNPIRHRIGPKR